MGATAKRKRAIANPHDGVGTTRYELYRMAWKRIESAAEAGYYLEAITLLESILTDRMESRASYLTGSNEGYKNLGPLIEILQKRETVPDFKRIIERIDAWREQRNEAIHEMVKFEDGERPTWEEKTAHLPDIVREGKDVLDEFDKNDKRERRKNGARPAATEPAAFGDEPLPRTVRPAG